MIERSIGIVLRVHPLTETSLVVHWVTRDFGRIGTVAKGARRAKSPFRGKLDLCYLAEFTFQRSRRSDLHSLHDLTLLNPHEGLRRDIARLQQAVYATRLIEQTTETDTPLPGIYEEFAAFVGELSTAKPAPHLVLAFELKILRELGLMPDLERSSDLTRKWLERLGTASWQELATLACPLQETEQLRSFLHGFIIYHLGRIPKGRAEALAG
jgi:DNA repair protein RecO (recombination protein O)